MTDTRFHHQFGQRNAWLLPWLLAWLLVICLFVLCAGSALAQESSGVYTVVSGDTLGAIASRFGVSLNSLIAANDLADPNVLNVGQILIIPGVAIAPDLSQITTGVVRAQPGDSVNALAARLAADGELVAALNNLTTTARLFPGQPLRVPDALVPADPLRFGSVVDVDLPVEISQGRTGRMSVETHRPLSLTVTWNGLNLPIAPLDLYTRQVALLPVPALLEVGAYSLTVAYMTGAGANVARTWQVQVTDGGYASQVVSIPADRQELLAPANVESELTKVGAAWSGATMALSWRGPFVRPITEQYVTTSPFGTRRNYDSGANSTDSYHAGQDFGAPEGVPVTAPAAGIVSLAEPLSIRGNAVILDHGRGVYTGYWHLSELRVTPGQSVGVGDVIGLVGNTGLSTGAHLHWELRINGVAVDPMQFVDEALFP
jgi:murein DD-endopeptidase MepM/ murein hydrolase activator NlpD